MQILHMIQVSIQAYSTLKFLKQHFHRNCFYMAAARCAGFAFPGAAWRLGGDEKFRKSHSGVSVATNPWRRRDDELTSNLGLGVGGGCGCQAAAKDPGYKRSQSKKASSKKSGKPSSSVAEAPDSLKQGRQQGARYSEDEESFVDADPVSSGGSPQALLKPIAGFVLDEAGKVILMAPPGNRIVTIVDPATRRPLECLVRRVFSSSDGEQCLLLLPLDMPLQILKITEEREGLMELSDAELEEVLPSAAYALAKRRLHLIVSGYCLTARGGFCYTERDVIDLNSEYGEGLAGSLNEGVEVATFELENNQYLMYTPFDPLMFVARKDRTTGLLMIADNELLDDEAVLDAIDEENEFQAIVDEEEAVNEMLRTMK